MVKESLNRLHPLVKFTCNGNIILNFIEEGILQQNLKDNNLKGLKSGDTIKIKGYVYEIEKINIEYSNNVHGDYGLPINYEGEFDDFNLLINVFLK